jgi:hypothetical protein
MAKSRPPGISRREFLGGSLAAAAAGLISVPAGTSPRGGGADMAAPADIGSRLELFVDDFLMGRLAGGARLELHHPEPREIALVHDAPWEGSGSGYHSVFRDGDLYRMYYKAWHLDVRAPGTVDENSHPLYCCYAESDDGVHWRKPDLGLFEFRGSKKNNITMAPGRIGAADPDPGHPAVFKDDNPDAPADARYKAIVRSKNPAGLLPLKSADGLHWTLMSETPVITAGAFDSQNLAFWNPARGEYRAYWRYFDEAPAAGGGRNPAGARAIRTAASRDFLHWGPWQDLRYVDSPPEQLYTNQVKPYHRAPHILIGFPARYVERGWTDSMRALPEVEHREWRAGASLRYGTALTEGLLMASRDGVLFKRWNEAFLRPGIERPGTWNYGQQYIAWHAVETKSALEGAPNELSLYASESYWTSSGSAVRRFTLRLDGFVSVNAPLSGGELVTRPILFAGRGLLLNFATSAAGDIRVEIQDAGGSPLAGFRAEDCAPLFGDAIERRVAWKNAPDVGRLAGIPVRLKFILRDADLYALRFSG